MKYRTKSNEDMNEKKREIRTIDCQLSVREQEGGQTGDSRTIQGRAIRHDGVPQYAGCKDEHAA